MQSIGEGPSDVYVEVYANRRLQENRLATYLRAGFWALVGLAIIAFAALGAILTVLNRIGITSVPILEPGPYDDPVPLWEQVVLGLLILGLGAGLCYSAKDNLRRVARSRSYVESGRPLESVEGAPLFQSSDDGPALLSLTVGGREFDLTECCSSGGGSAGDYTWGMSSSILGVMRAWYVPDTGLLVRAEWRASEADEVIGRVNAAIAENWDWASRLCGRCVPAASDARVAQDIVRILEQYQGLIQDDCRKLQSLAANLAPGVPPGVRRKTEEEYDTITARIGLTKSAVLQGLKVARAALPKDAYAG